MLVARLMHAMLVQNTCSCKAGGNLFIFRTPSAHESSSDSGELIRHNCTDRGATLAATAVGHRDPQVCYNKVGRCLTP